VTFKTILTMAALATLTACASTPPPVKAPPPKVAPGKRPPASRPAPLVVTPGTELDRVIGKDARALAQLFGTASADVREGDGRKLQFKGSQCILDAYLYPPTKGRAPIVTYVAARTLDGKDAERNSCIGALRRN
jgi:hypothetical protein